MIIKFKKICPFLFYFVILFVRLPNFYLLPFHSSLFLSNNILRFLLLFIFVIYLYFLIKEKKQSVINSKLSFLVVIFFVSQSISILQAQNIQSFFAVYKDVVFGILLYFSALFVLDATNINRYTSFIRFVVFCTLVVQIVMIISFQFRDIIYSILNESYLQFFKFQVNRGRYFGDTLEEAFIPILLFGAFINPTNIYTKIIGKVGFVFSFYISYISNWRTKFIIFIASLFSSIYLYKRKFLIFFSLFLIFAIGILSVINTSTVTGIDKSVIDRFLSDDISERSTNKSRPNYFYDACAIGLSHPITGVGLGNYYDYLSQKAKNNNKSSDGYSKGFILIDDPHNIFMSTFASSGFIGLFSLLLLLYAFLKHDFQQLLSSSCQPYLKAYICVFWSIFILAIFNPWLSFTYLCNFWLIRAFVDSSQKSQYEI